MISVLIIDDEELARAVIKSYLKDQEDMQIIGECTNGFEGILKIQELNPDIIFLDIQMPKLNGFEMLELLDSPPVVIFSTAYDEYAIKAFENNAADYLLKPYSKQRFNDALEKAKLRLNTNQRPEREVIRSMAEGSTMLERIAIRNGPNIVIIPTSTISHIEAQDDYVAIFSAGKKYMKQYTMRFLEQSLSKDQFVRVHRSYIVNVTKISRLEAMTKDSFLAILQDNTQVPVSKSGYGALKDILKI